MAKRFTDTEKWKRDWFIRLAPKEKAFWMYLCDTCSPAGVWNVSWKSAEFHIGAKLNRSKIAKTFAKQYIPLDGGRRWFLIDFIPFQYKRLSPNNVAHRGTIEELRKYDLLDVDYCISLPDNAPKGATEGLGRGLDAPKDKDKAKAKALVTDKAITSTPEVFR